VTVRVVRQAHPRPEDRRHDGPYEEVLMFERAYQDGDRVIAVDPKNQNRKGGPRQFTRQHLVEVDFEGLSVIPYERMVREIGGDVDALSAAAVDSTVERLV